MREALTRRAAQCKFKVDVEGVDGGFEGYGSVFNVLDSYSDIVAPGAFTRTLSEARAKGRLPALLWQHDATRPIGVYEDMREDGTGLLVRGRLALQTPDGASAYELMKMGALSGLSIGFITRNAQIDRATGVRTVTDVELLEVSPVTFPANDAARITGVKAADGTLPTEREFERWLRREAGFTEAEAKTIIAKGFRQVQREAAAADDVRGLLESVRRFGAIATGV